MYSRLIGLTSAILIFLTPLCFWTLTPNFFSTPKESLLYLATFIALSTYALYTLKTRSLTLPNSPLTLPLFFFFCSVLLTLLANPIGRPEALAGKGLIYLSLALFTLSSLSLPLTPKFLSWIEFSVLGSTLLLSLHSLLSLTYLYRQSFLPTFMQTQSFTPTGSYIHTATLIILGIVLAASKIKDAPSKSRPFYLMHLTFSLIALVAIFSLMLPTNPLAPTLIPYQESWGITLDALKSARTLFFGIGLANFPLLYAAVKPLSLNLSPVWNILPSSNHSELLTLTATGGIVLTLALLFLFLRALSTSPSRRLLILALFAIITLLPTSLTHYLLLFVLLITTGSEPNKIALKSYWRIIAPVSVFALALGLAYYSSLPLFSEVFMRKAQLALEKNDGKTVYDEHKKTLSLSPKISSYHLSFASVNFSLASALSQKPDITDEDRQNVAQLIQQSIQSAKNATYLRPSDSSAWLTLANTYQNLIGVADGAEQFTLEAYARAISLDRANPDLRIKYASTLTKLYNTETDATKKNSYLSRAENEYQTAIQLKSDYPNSYYNIGKFYQAIGKNDLAKTAFEKALTLLPADSSNIDQLRVELDNLTLSPSPLQSSSATPSPLPLDTAPIELNQ